MPVYCSNVRERLDTKQAATLSTGKARNNTTNAVPDIHSAHTRTTLHLFPRPGSLVEGNSLRQESDQRGMCPAEPAFWGVQSRTSPAKS